MSLGSVCAAVSLPIQCFAWGFDPVSVGVVAAVALVVVWAHRSNVKKLIAGEERKFAFHKSDDNADTVGE